MLDILNWVLIAAAVPLIAWLVIRASHRSKELSERIEQYHEEQEAAKQQPGGLDPYRDLAELFGSGKHQQQADQKTADQDLRE